MVSLSFDRNFDVQPGVTTTLSPLIRRVLADNPGPFTFKGTASFVIGHGDVAIIDPGPDSDAHFAALLAAVKGEKVRHILVTHSHLDHSPLARRLQKATGAPIAGHELATRRDRQDADALRLDASIDADFDPDIKLRHGEAIAGPGWTLEGVFTPGHMSNHMSYALKEEKTLFCGDHVMAWATSVIAPPDGNMGQYLASLRLLFERDDAIYHPAHGPSRHDPKTLVRAYLVHRKMREEAIIARLKAGDRSIDDIVRANYADIDPRLHAAAGLSTLAHIEHLIERGLVYEGPRGGAGVQYFAT
jgi:glyoxylase-like metal-dependent hydrolase (beta-lactamase superfamily II)